MLKFRVSSMVAYNAEGFSDISTAMSSLSSTFSGIEEPETRKRSHSFVAEETGRFSSRRSSIPDEEFVSISDRAKSVNDLADGNENSIPPFLGQTSSSFVYNGKIMDRKNLDDIKVIDANHVGYDDSNDIPPLVPMAVPAANVLGEGEQQSDGSGSDSPPPGPNNVDLLADLDFGSVSNPQLFPLPGAKDRYPKRPFPRFVWRRKGQFVIAYLAFFFGLRTMVQVPLKAVEDGRGLSFLVAYTMSMFFIGCPLVYIMSIVGQSTAKYVTSAFATRPIYRGIGFGLLTFMAFLAIYKTVIITHSATYFFPSYLIPGYVASNETECDPQKWKSEDVCNNNSIQSSTCDYCINPNGSHFYNLTMMESFVRLEDCSNFHWGFCAALFFILGSIFVFTQAKQHLLYDISLFFHIAPALGLLILSFAFGKSPSDELFRLESSHFVDRVFWKKVVDSFAISMIPAIGSVTCMASYNRQTVNLTTMVPVMIAMQVIVTVFAVYFIASIIDLDRMPVDNYYDFAFNVLPAILKVRRIWHVVIFFVTVFVAEVNGTVIIVEVLTSSLLEVEWIKKHSSRMMVAAILASVLFFSSIWAGSCHGHFLRLAFDHFFTLEITLMALISVIAVGSVCWSSISKTEALIDGSLKWWMRIFLFIGVPLALIIQSLTIIWRFSFPNLNEETSAYDAIAWLMFIAVVGQPFIYGLTLVLKRVKSKMSVTELFHADINWPHATSPPQGDQQNGQIELQEF